MTQPNPAGSELVERVLRGQGPYPARAADDPAFVNSIAATLHKTYSVRGFCALLRASIPTDASEAQVMQALRQFKRRETLRVYVREVEQIVSVRQSTSEISAIAQATLSASVDHAARLLGDPTLAQGFVVLGMGKLGGEELNFSSDVDLIYVCQDEVGENGHAYERLARLVTKLMDENTADGYVFRVDLRLRPEGRRGPIVQCVTPMIDYYASWGRTWERSALLKARPVAGNVKLGQNFLLKLNSFIYRKYLDFQAIEELRGMKDAINRNAQVAAVVGLKTEPAEEPKAEVSALKSRLQNKLRGHGGPRRRSPTIRAQEEAPNISQPAEVDTSGLLGWDVKIGIGGIREIEFFVQALQLVHCGTQPNLRVRNTLDALDRLLYGGLISDDDHQTLAGAYGFLRLVEHRVQMQHDRQGHTLPTSSVELGELALRLRMSEADLRNQLMVYRSGVQSIFGRLFAERSQEGGKATLNPAKPAVVDSIVAAADSNHPAVLASLKTLGFQRPKQVAGQIQILRESDQGPFLWRSTAKQTELAVFLIHCAAEAPDPDQAFSQLTRYLTLVGDKPGFYTMLGENPHATRLLLHVFGSSRYLAAALLREPAIFSRLIGAGTVAIRRLKSEMQADLGKRLHAIEDPEHRIGIIRRFHQEETLRIGLHETGGAASVNVTTEQLSLLAEVIIEQVLTEVYEPLRTRRRRPGSKLPPLADIPFGIIGMGKLGGHELGFGSDLDIVFVYQDDRQWRLEHAFFSRLAQRIVRTLSSAGVDGRMYEVDTRLRPSGQQGALVVSLEALKQYHETAELWERQALLRARMISSNRGLEADFEATRLELLFGRPLPANAQSSVADMLNRVRASVLAPGVLDVKFSPGALLDIEFMTQFLQLELGQELHPKEAPFDSAFSPHTHRAISALAQQPSVAHYGLDLEQLGLDYLRLRAIEARIRIATQRSTSEVPSDPKALHRLARRVGLTGADAGRMLSDEIEALRGRVRAAIRIVFEK